MPDKHPGGEQYIFGEFVLQANGALLHKTQRISIPPKELGVLTILLASCGKLVTKDYLLDTVWPDEDASEESLTRCIYALRRILVETKQNRYIDTVYGKGYRFCRPVAMVLANPQQNTSKCKLALLPFKTNNSQDKHHLHDALIQHLSRYAQFGLLVLPATLTQQCDNTDELMRVIERFTPDYYLAGHSTLSRGERVLCLELIRAKDHVLIHRENIEWRTEEDTCKLQRRLPNLCAQHIPGLHYHKNQPVMLESFDIAIAYLNGKHELLTYTPTSLKKALLLFRQCVANNPEHVMSWCGLAETYIALSSLGLIQQTLAHKEAQLAITKALAFEPDNPLALSLLAAISFTDNDIAADALFRQITLLAPESSHTHYYHAWHLFASARMEDALRAIHLCLEYEPNHIAAAILKATLQFCVHHTEEAISTIKAHLNEHAHNHIILQSLLAVFLHETGHSKPAQTLSEAIRIQGESEGIVALNCCYIDSGQNEIRARQTFNQLLENHEHYAHYAPLLPLVLKFNGVSAARLLHQQLSEKRYHGLNAIMCDPRLNILRIVVGAQMPEAIKQVSA